MAYVRGSVFMHRMILGLIDDSVGSSEPIKYDYAKTLRSQTCKKLQIRSEWKIQEVPCRRVIFYCFVNIICENPEYET